MIKINDVINVTMSIELLDVPEDLKVIDVDNYNREYNIEYCVNEECVKDINMETEPGYWNDIKEYIEENLLRDIEEISEYEILETDSQEYDYQKAKIRVKAVK